MRGRKIHDWQHRSWGNNYIFRPREQGQFAHMNGWRSGLCAGDVLVLYGEGGQRAAYIIDSIQYESDPPDMFSAELHYEHGCSSYSHP
jgi:hypothetical protein